MTVINHVCTFHAASHGAVDDDRANQIAHIGRFASGGIAAYTHFAQFCQQFVRSVNNGGDYFAGDKQFVTSDSGRNKYIVYRTHTQQVVDVHDQCILGNTFPH